MNNKDTPVALLRRLSLASPGGFAVALHIQFAAPKYLFQSYPRKWIEYYSKNGLVMQDPTVRWGFGNLGAIRWSELADDDPAQVMDHARQHGLKYGVTIAQSTDGLRSVASFSRADRVFADEELAAISDCLASLHSSTQSAEILSPDDHETLKQMSIYLTHG